LLKYTLRQLEHFVAVTNAGGIAQAARLLGLSPAAIAASVGRLEEVLGLCLFDRHHAKGLNLTPDGEAFYPHASALLTEAERLQIHGRELSDGTIGHLRFGCYLALAYIFAPQIVLQHQQDWPGVSLDLTEDNFSALSAKLLSADLDLVLAYDQGFDPALFIVTPIGRVSPRVILPSTHPLAGRDRLSLDELSDTPYIAVRENGPGPSYLDMMRGQWFEPQVAMVSRSYEMVRSCVGKGMGFTLAVFQPPNPVTYHGDGVTAVPLATPVGELEIVIATRRPASPAPAHPSLARFSALCAQVVMQGIASRT
jgi:DNA-binding transcriptional LysR family regulator